MLSINKIVSYQQNSFYQLYAFGLWGVQILLLFLYVFSLTDESQTFTIPFRFLVVAFSLFIFMKYKSIRVLQQRQVVILVFIFYLFLVLRILFDGFILDKNLGKSGATYLLQLGSTVIVPSLAFMTPLNSRNLMLAEKGLKHTCLVFLILGIFLYRENLGSDYRSLVHFNDVKRETLISPMAFSYIGFTLLGLVMWETLIKKKIGAYNLIEAAIALYAMVWSASRGAIISLILLLIYLTLSKTKRVSSFVKIIGIWIISISLTMLALHYSGSHLLDRFETLRDGIETNSNDVGSLRKGIWERGFQQFSEQPFLGSGIEEKYIKYVAHNMYLESLMATGLLGSLVFLVIILKTLKRGHHLLMVDSNAGWIGILCMERMLTGLFSTSILDPIFWLPVVALHANGTFIKKKT